MPFSLSTALGSRNPSVVTSSTRHSGRSDRSSHTTSRAAVDLPTATLPPSAIRNGTALASSPRKSPWALESSRAASTRSSSSRASGM